MSSQNYGPQGYHQPPPPQDYGQPQHPVQPQFYTAPQKRKGFPKAILAVIVVVVVVVVVIVAALLLLGNDQGSPEDVVNAYFEEMSDRDYQDLTTEYFNDEPYAYDLVSIDKVEYKNDLSNDEQDSYEYQIEEMEDEYDVKVTNYAVVEITVRTTYDGDTDTNDTTQLVVEIGGKWYIYDYWYY